MPGPHHSGATRRVRRWVALASALAVLCSLAACSSTAAPRPLVLTIGTDDIQNTATGREILHFAAEVKRVSNGAVTIKPRWEAAGSGILNWDQAVARLVVKGDLDLGLIPSRAWDTEGVTSLQALSAPFAITTDAELAEVVSGDYTEKLLSGLPAVGVVGLDLFPEGLRHPFAFDQPLLGPADYDGTVIRTPTSRTVTKLFAALGANAEDADYDPTRQVGGESSYDRAQPKIATANVTFFPKVNTLVANETAWSKLSDPQQKMLDAAAASTRAWILNTFPTDREAATQFCLTGGTVVAATTADLTGLQAMTQPVVDKLSQDPLTRSILDRLATAKVSASDPPPTSCGELVKPAAARLDINGTYRVTTTAADLATGGVTDKAAVNEQAGTFTWTFKDGRFHFEQQTDYPVKVPRGSGSYTIDGSRFTLYWSANPGDYTEATVTIASDRSLVFTEITDGSPELQLISEVTWGAHPLVRVGD